MSELQLSARHALIAAALGVLVALVSAIVVEAQPGYAAKPKCPAAKRARTCPKTSTRPRYKTVRRRVVVLAPHAGAQEGLSEVVTLECPHGEQVLGGGVEIFEPFLTVTLSAPDEATTGWSAQIANLSTTTDVVASLGIYAICEIESGSAR